MLKKKKNSIVPYRTDIDKCMLKQMYQQPHMKIKMATCNHWTDWQPAPECYVWFGDLQIIRRVLMSFMILDILIETRCQ